LRVRHQSVTDEEQNRLVVSTLALGFAAGAFGALVPSPLAVTLVERIGRGERGPLLTRGLGAGVLHLTVCVALGLFAGPMVRTSGLSVVLPFIYLAFGIALVVREIGGEWPGTYTLIGKWVLSIGLGATFIASDLQAGAGFALGVWLGILAWFAVFSAVAKLSGPALSGAALHRSTLLAAAAWVALAVYAGGRVLAGA
jgi:MFS family permease